MELDHIFIIINTAKLLARKDEVVGSCRQGANACLQRSSQPSLSGVSLPHFLVLGCVRLGKRDCFRVLVLISELVFNWCFLHFVCLSTVGTVFVGGVVGTGLLRKGPGDGGLDSQDSLSQLSVLNLSGSKSKCFGSVPQSPPKVRTPWVLRGWTSARLRLWCCIKNTQEMPAGTLRKVSGSEPFRTAWMHWMDVVLNVQDLEALDRPLATAVCQTRVEEGEGRSPSTSWLSRLSFSQRGSG